MKTLDEVIKALECCELGSMYSMCESCPYTGIGNCNIEIQEDALHYLKKYREEYKTLIKTINEAVDVEMKYYDMIEELERNSPLTWEELKQMEGKPIWIETDDNEKFWIVVDNFRTICNQECLCCSKGYMCRSTYVRGDWQAYRKEH